MAKPECKKLIGNVAQKIWSITMEDVNISLKARDKSKLQKAKTSSQKAINLL